VCANEADVAQLERLVSEYGGSAQKMIEIISISPENRCDTANKVPKEFRGRFSSMEQVVEIRNDQAHNAVLQLSKLDEIICVCGAQLRLHFNYASLCCIVAMPTCLHASQTSTILLVVPFYDVAVPKRPTSKEVLDKILFESGLDLDEDIKYYNVDGDLTYDPHLLF
jgi:hypothetical protein